MVMELCQGGELVSFLLEQGTHSEAQAVLVMRQVFRAVEYLHSHAICHRDLKPENLLLLTRRPIKDNVLKVTDFGLSALCPPGSELRGMMGTLPYMAPQVCSGRYDLSADLWSCGVLTYLLLSGYPPFWHEQDLPRTTSAIKRGNFAFPSQDWSMISQDGKAIVRELLKMNPSERMTARSACRHSWLTGTPPTGVLDDSLHRLRRFMKQMIATQVVSEDPLLGKAQPQTTLEAFFSAIRAPLANAICTCSSDACSGSSQYEVHYVRPEKLGDSLYTIGMRVHYQSMTHRAWLPTVVVDVNDAGVPQHKSKGQLGPFYMLVSTSLQDVEIEIKPRVCADLAGISAGYKPSPADENEQHANMAKLSHPDAGGSKEDFQRLRGAYALLRKALLRGGLREAEDDRRQAEARWEQWESQVEQGQELAKEGDVVFWRPGRGDEWSAALVLAVQVVYEPSSGPHGWIYLQPLLPRHGELFDADADAEMEQVEPVSLDGVNWAFARSVEEIGDGVWRLAPPEYLPP
ncbi:CPK2 [Symbiodinium pilosum]|uniref:CPK2 protein n=1 Tax=Symbiodinium pilosum TaxID=2952 RepID=A0A812SBE5_SYMPI|nr:CPK2 [Symbiodinium pilosum]